MSLKESGAAQVADEPNRSPERDLHRPSVGSAPAPQPDPLRQALQETGLRQSVHSLSPSLERLRPRAELLNR